MEQGCGCIAYWQLHYYLKAKMNNGRLEMELHKIGGILDRVHWKSI